jgi:adenosine kinase
MRIAVTGSIATEHLMTFPGSFANQFPADAPHTVALSFLVDTLDIRRGGTAANIAFGLGRLGGRPLLIGAAGPDFGEYRCWLSAHGVDTRFVHVSPTRHTARRLAITDDYHNQISAFHAGAMTEARTIALRPILAAAGGVDLVLIAPDDPEAMLRHTAECRTLGIPFAADPAQHLTTLGRADIQSLVDGATFLFTDESERDLLLSTTRWTAADVLARVGTWITTLGPRGVRIESAGLPIVSVGAVPDRGIVDPTGVGAAFRAGFLSGLARHLPPVRSAQLGCQLATIVLEARGAQDYDLDPDMFLKRLDEAYGPDAAADAEPIMRAAREINEAHHIRGYN